MAEWTEMAHLLCSACGFSHQLGYAGDDCIECGSSSTVETAPLVAFSDEELN